MRLIILFAVALLRPAPTDAFTDWLTDGAEDLLDATKEGARGLIGTTREMLSEIDGQDVFDSLGKVIGAVKDGVLELSDATGITGEDVYDAAGNLLGAIGDAASKAAVHFGLNEIDGEDVYNAAGIVVGHVKNGVIFLSNTTGISGEDLYDGAKNVVGQLADSVKTGAEQSEVTTEDAFQVVKDGVAIGIAIITTGIEFGQAATVGGSCTVICALAEKRASDSKGEGEEDTNDLTACLADCATTFGDTTGEIAANVLDGVAAMLEENVCSSVDIVAEVLGATITDLGRKSADALDDAVTNKTAEEVVTGDQVNTVVASLTAAGGDLFTAVLKGSCQVVECLGIAIPNFSNAARNGIDADAILADLDAALVDGEDLQVCIDAYAALADPVVAACSTCGAGCKDAVKQVSDDQIAAVNTACTAAKSAMLERGSEITGCIANLTNLDERAMELFSQEKLKLDEELSRGGDKLNLVASKYAVKCSLDPSASVGRTAPSAEAALDKVAAVRAAIAGCRAAQTTVGCDAASLAKLVQEEADATATAASLGASSTATVLSSRSRLASVGFALILFSIF